MRKKKKRLLLTKESLRDLSKDGMGKVVGGTKSVPDTNPPPPPDDETNDTLSKLLAGCIASLSGSLPPTSASVVSLIPRSDLVRR